MSEWKTRGSEGADSPVRARRKSELGRRGEEAVARYLLAQGYRILERNVRLGHDELDIVAEDGDEIVFVEVRARTTDEVLSPEQSVDRFKRSRLIRAAAQWLAVREKGDRYCRFDIVAVRVGERGELRIHHVPGAFVQG